MMRLLLAALLLAVTPALAQSPQITVRDAWARATAPGAPTGAAFFTITATGAPDRLIGATTPVAATAEVHETISDNGVMKMRPVEGGLPLEAGKPATLKPGSYHLMLMGMKQQLKPGDRFPVTLRFARAPEQTVQVTVAPAGAAGPSM
jgi:copper(I)-binding protein